jgi:hypothetical protein
MKKFIPTLLACIGLAQTAIGEPIATTEDSWFVAEAKVNGNPLIVRARNKLPNNDTRKDFIWLTTISWSYSLEPNGMPEREAQSRMNVLEDTIESQLERHGFCIQAISRTGNGKKEWSYYIRDREAFMEAFNKAMEGQLPFPIEINFFHDPQWLELNNLLMAVKK